ncbi:MAG: helicase-exonuclease AddAB subunit AddA [Clostridia bacterium]|nr:helicase-exonuclease AddAB subunit AddA [Clostridia bacterium]
MYQLDKKWTPAQADAITSRGETLLVSAAAGSGKTAVLTERIISRIMDEQGALDVSAVLVVTFTRAAAAELKSRIRAALERALAADPMNRRLQTQLMNIGRARICTIDSFCLDLIRAHFEELSLSPRVAVADEAQARLIEKTVMNGVIDDLFDGNLGEETGISDIGALMDLLVSARSSQALADVLISLRNTLSGYAEGIGWLDCQIAEAARAADGAFFDSRAGRVMRDALTSFAAHWSRVYGQLCFLIESDPVYEKNYGACFAYERRWIDTLRRLLADGAEYAALYAHIRSFDAPALRSGIRGDKKTAEIIRAKARHDAFTERRKKLSSRWFSVDEAELAVLCAEQARVLGELSCLLHIYEDRLAREKQKRGVLDFSDMGSLALRLLWDRERGCPTETARAEAQKYAEIYIDEYQDVSPVQDLIFRAISGDNNRFMVGDAKQSIYGFRGASPALFLGYRQAFSARTEPGRCVFLSDNFRCDAPVIDFSNLIFSVLFGCGGGALPYTEEDALRYAKPIEGQAQQTAVSLALLPNGTLSQEEQQDESGEDDGGEAAADEDYTEAEYVAERIAELLRSGKKRDGTAMRPRDIAVLLRSTRTSAAPIAEALEKRHIPTHNSVSRAFFENAEVMLVYCLLSVIDNPQKDVCLASVLKSPLYRVSLDELIHIRREYPDAALYDALCAFTQAHGFAKGQYFLDRLAHYRHLSEGMPVDRFLWMLYQDTGMLSLVYEKEHHPLFTEALDSTQMRANLMMFYEYARTFEKSGFQGLYQFVSFIGSVIEEKAKLPPVLLSGEDADAVRIMTVHQSKGLEFPAVFLCGCGKRFNAADQRAPILIDADAGIATYLGEETGFARIDHPMRECIKEAIAEKQKEEEMRVLYVALTRAREQLYVSGSCRDPEEALAAFDYTSPEEVSHEHLFSQSTPLSWMLTAIAAHGAEAARYVEIVLPSGRKDTACDGAAAEKTSSDAAAGGISYAEAKARIERAFSFVYEDAYRTELPAKLSVSELHRLQTEASGMEYTGEGPADDGEACSYARPRFLTADTGATAAQRGTATHTFMQFCDYAALADPLLTPMQRIDREIERLCLGQFLTRESAAQIERDSLVRFLASDLFRALTDAHAVRREMRFNLFVPSADLPGFSGTEASVLVQGIVDCYYTDADGRVTVIDYKTDHFSRAQLADPGAVEQILLARHAGQLAYYRTAVEQMLCKPVSDVRIYSFALGYDFSVLAH